MPTVTGIEKCYVAVMDPEDTSDAVHYASPKYYENIQEFDVKPKQNTEKQYAENRMIDQATELDSYDVDLTLAALSSAQKAELLGQTVADEGGVYATQEDVAPYVAILYRATIKGGKRYGILYKGKFGLPDTSYKTKEGKPQYISPKCSATFQPLNYEVTTPTGKKHLTEWHIDTTDPNCPADIDDTWFTTAMHFPGTDVTAPTVTVSPADEATGVAASSNTVWTFSKAIDALTVTKNNFMLLSGGNAVAGTLGLDSTGKIVTFHPTANLASGSYVAICTANVKSATGVSLTAITIVNFTV